MFVLPKNGLFHCYFSIKKARNRLNVGQILFTIHSLSKRPGRGAWDFINGGGLLIRGGDYFAPRLLLGAARAGRPGGIIKGRRLTKTNTAAEHVHYYLR